MTVCFWFIYSIIIRPISVIVSEFVLGDIRKVWRVVSTTFKIIPDATGGFPISVELVDEVRYTEVNFPR